MSGQHDQWTALQEPVENFLMTDQGDPVAPGGRVKFARDVEDLHQHHAEMQVDPPDDPVAIAFGVLVAERLSEILDPDLPMSLVNPVQDRGQSSGEGVGLLDTHRLTDSDDQANQKIDRIIDEFVGTSLQRSLLRPGNLGTDQNSIDREVSVEPAPD